MFAPLAHQRCREAAAATAAKTDCFPEKFVMDKLVLPPPIHFSWETTGFGTFNWAAQKWDISSVAPSPLLFCGCRGRPGGHNSLVAKPPPPPPRTDPCQRASNGTTTKNSRASNALLRTLAVGDGTTQGSAVAKPFLVFFRWLGANHNRSQTKKTHCTAEQCVVLFCLAPALKCHTCIHVLAQAFGVRAPTHPAGFFPLEGWFCLFVCLEGMQDSIHYMCDNNSFCVGVCP